jgi:transposase
VVNKSTGVIICLAHDKGRCHDFSLLKKSKTGLHPKTKAVTDMGYLGLQKIHAQTEMPKKSSKNNPLSPEDKARNRAISKKRILCENVIAVIKRFRIVAERYRNRRKRFKLRMALIAAIYNRGLNV